MGSQFRQRVGERRTQAPPSAAPADGSGAVARTTADPVPVLLGKIRRMEEQFQLAMPRGLEAQQLIRDAVTVVRQNPGLAECTHDSVLGGLMTIAQLGLRVGVLGHAWLLPMRDNRGGVKKATLVIGYQGYKELAHRSGAIASLMAHTVYEHDEFEVEFGLSDKLRHVPNLAVADRGQPVAYYVVAHMTNGGHAFHVMSHHEIIAWRDRNAMAVKWVDGVRTIVGPWADNLEPMAHKTVWLRLAKWVPLSADLELATAADETIRLDYGDPDAAYHGERPALPGDVFDQLPDADPPAEPADEPAADEQPAAGPGDDSDAAAPAGAGDVPRETTPGAGGDVPRETVPDDEPAPAPAAAAARHEAARTRARAEKAQRGNKA